MAGVEGGAVLDLARQGGALSSVVTIEPRRRKFHKAITVSIPLPECREPQQPGPAGQTGQLTELRENLSIETNLLVSTRTAALSRCDCCVWQLLCSMSGAGYRSVWEDVTLSTPLSFTQNSVQFTTVVSAQFWLLRLSVSVVSRSVPTWCRLPAWMAADKLSLADSLYRQTSRAPYLARAWLYWRPALPQVSSLHIIAGLHVTGRAGIRTRPSWS